MRLSPEQESELLAALEKFSGNPVTREGSLELEAAVRRAYERVGCGRLVIPSNKQRRKRHLPPTFGPPDRSLVRQVLPTPVQPAVRGKRSRWPAGKGYESAKSRLAWMLADPCAYCGEPGDTWDHIDPRKRGGDNADDNFVRACSSCNYEKSSRKLLVFLALRAQKKQDGTWKKRRPMSPKFRARAGNK